jgi:membrane protein involved in colicin uptake
MLTKVYFKENPVEPVEMFEIDANGAVAQHPNEWSFKPWPKSEKADADAATKKKADDEAAAKVKAEADAKAKADADAKTNGQS